METMTIPNGQAPIPEEAELVSAPGAMPVVKTRARGAERFVSLERLLQPPRQPRHDWNQDGVVILPEAIPERLMVAYEELWMEENGYRGNRTERRPGRMLDAERPGGFVGCTPYTTRPEIRELVSPLAPVLLDLMKEPAGLHLNLTGWVSTTRNWHQDTYLNPPEVGDFYAAVWIALDDIHPDSGPFQYVPGSHLWGEVTRDRILPCMDEEEAASHNWPRTSERLLTPLFRAEIERRRAEVVSYLPKRGDALIWHGRLLHRGSIPNVMGMERRAFIGHFSGVHHRPDMAGTWKTDPSGTVWFDLGGGVRL